MNSAIGGASEELDELTSLYVGEMPARIDALKAAFGDHDWDGLTRLAHQLSGSAGSYGFPELSRLARRLEALLIGNGSTEDTTRAFEELMHGCALLKWPA